MAKIGKNSAARLDGQKPDFIAEETARMLRDEAAVLAHSQTEEGRKFLLETVAGTKALCDTQVGVNMLMSRIWRLSHLYRFRHIETSNPISLDLTEPYMMEIYNGIYGENNETLRNIILKSRQVFVTTLACAFAIDLCVRSKNQLVSISNSSADEVARTIEDKLHFCLRNSPFLQLIGVQAYASGLYFPSTESRIQASMTGRGRTMSFALITEFAKTSFQDNNKAKEVRAGMLTATEFAPIIIESSSKGPYGVFYEMCKESHKLKQAGVRLDRKSFRFHFISWPQKKLNWLEYTPYDTTLYDHYFKKVEYDQSIIIKPEQRNWWVSTLHNEFQGNMRSMAEEHPGTVEEAFEIDSEAFILKHEMRNMRESGRILPIARNFEYPLVCFWDFGWSDHTAFVIAQESDGGFVEILYEEAQSHKKLDWFFEQIDELEQPIKYHVLPNDAYGNHPHVNKELIKGSTTIAGFFKKKKKHNIIRLPKIGLKRAGFEASRQFAASCRIDSSCTKLLSSLVSVRRRYIHAGNCYVDRLPEHDKNNHLYDCFESIARCRLDLKRVFGTGGLPEYITEFDENFISDNSISDTLIIPA